MNESYIKVSNGQTTSYVGPEATRLFQAKVLFAALSMYGKAKIQATRTCSPTQMLKLAEGFSKKRYKRGEYLKAAEDVKHWARTMEAALPVISSLPSCCPLCGKAVGPCMMEGCPWA